MDSVNTPKYEVAICMPYFERRKALLNTMNIFYDLYEKEFMEERYVVSLVDDGSIREPLEATRKPWIVVSRLPDKTDWRNPCVPLNRAVSQVDSTYILLQSPETYHESRIIPKMVAAVKWEKDVALSTVHTDTGSASKLKWYAHPRFRPARWWFCQLMQRSFWKAVGGMDEDFREGDGWDDNDLESRLTENGARWKWLEDCVACHQQHDKTRSKLSNKALFRQKRGHI